MEKVNSNVLLAFQSLSPSSVEARQLLNTLHVNDKCTRIPLTSDMTTTILVNNDEPDAGDTLTGSLEEEITCTSMQRMQLFFTSDPFRRQLLELQYRLRNYSRTLTTFRTQVGKQSDIAERIFRQNSTIIGPRRLYQIQLYGRFSLLPLFQLHDEVTLRLNSQQCILLRLAHELLSTRINEAEALIKTTEIRCQDLTLRKNQHGSQKQQNINGDTRNRTNATGNHKRGRSASYVDELQLLLEETSEFLQPVQRYLLTNSEYVHILKKRSRLTQRAKLVKKKVSVVGSWLDVETKRHRGELLERLLMRKERDQERFRKYLGIGVSGVYIKNKQQHQQTTHEQKHVIEGTFTEGANDRNTGTAAGIGTTSPNGISAPASPTTDLFHTNRIVQSTTATPSTSTSRTVSFSSFDSQISLSSSFSNLVDLEFNEQNNTNPDINTKEHTFVEESLETDEKRIKEIPNVMIDDRHPVTPPSSRTKKPQNVKIDQLSSVQQHPDSQPFRTLEPLPQRKPGRRASLYQMEMEFCATETPMKAENRKFSDENPMESSSISSIPSAPYQSAESQSMDNTQTGQSTDSHFSEFSLDSSQVKKDSKPKPQLQQPRPPKANTKSNLTTTKNFRLDRVALSFEAVAFDARLEEGRLTRSWFQRLLSRVHQAHLHKKQSQRRTESMKSPATGKDSGLSSQTPKQQPKPGVDSQPKPDDGSLRKAKGDSSKELCSDDSLGKTEDDSLGKAKGGDSNNELSESGKNSEFVGFPVTPSLLPSPREIIAFVNYFSDILLQKYDLPHALAKPLQALCEQQFFLRLAPLCRLYSQDVVQKRDRLWQKQLQWVVHLSPEEIGIRKELLTPLINYTSTENAETTNKYSSSSHVYTKAIRALQEMQNCFEPSYLRASLLGVIRAVYREAEARMEASTSIGEKDFSQEDCSHEAAMTTAEETEEKTRKRRMTNTLLGMEDIFPVLTYVLVQSQIPCIHEIFAFMENFCEPQGEIDYYLTALQSNVTYVLRVLKRTTLLEKGDKKNMKDIKNLATDIKTLATDTNKNLVTDTHALNSGEDDHIGSSSLKHDEQKYLKTANANGNDLSQDKGGKMSLTSTSDPMVNKKAVIDGDSTSVSNDGGLQELEELNLADVDLHLPNDTQRDKKAMREMEDWLISKSMKEDVLQTLMCFFGLYSGQPQEIGIVSYEYCKYPACAAFKEIVNFKLSNVSYPHDWTFNISYKRAKLINKAYYRYRFRCATAEEYDFLSQYGVINKYSTMKTTCNFNNDKTRYPEEVIGIIENGSVVANMNLLQYDYRLDSFVAIAKRAAKITENRRKTSYYRKVNFSNPIAGRFLCYGTDNETMSCTSNNGFLTYEARDCLINSQKSLKALTHSVLARDYTAQSHYHIFNNVDYPSNLSTFQDELFKNITKATVRFAQEDHSNYLSPRSTDDPSHELVYAPSKMCFSGSILIHNEAENPRMFSLYEYQSIPKLTFCPDSLFGGVCFAQRLSLKSSDVIKFGCGRPPYYAFETIQTTPHFDEEVTTTQPTESVTPRSNTTKDMRITTPDYEGPYTSPVHPFTLNDNQDSFEFVHTYVNFSHLDTCYRSKGIARFFQYSTTSSTITTNDTSFNTSANSKMCSGVLCNHVAFLANCFEEGKGSICFSNVRYGKHNLGSTEYADADANELNIGRFTNGYAQSVQICRNPSAPCVVRRVEDNNLPIIGCATNEETREFYDRIAPEAASELGLKFTKKITNRSASNKSIFDFTDANAKYIFNKIRKTRICDRQTKTLYCYGPLCNVACSADIIPVTPPETVRLFAYSAILYDFEGCLENTFDDVRSCVGIHSPNSAMRVSPKLATLTCTIIILLFLL
eukprot:g2706.t1